MERLMRLAQLQMGARGGGVGLVWILGILFLFLGGMLYFLSSAFGGARMEAREVRRGGLRLPYRLRRPAYSNGRTHSYTKD